MFHGFNLEKLHGLGGRIQRRAVDQRNDRVGVEVCRVERGSGIGLSLVAGIAESHHATIQTGTGLEGRGLMVRVVFPGLVGANAMAQRVNA